MRPGQHEYFLKMAALAATRSTCARRSVGCILVNKDKHVIATGYNGTPRGFSHCQETPCEGVQFPSGVGLDKCLAVHAEQNALIQCRNTMEIETCYSTSSPCIQCMKMLMNTSCQSLYFREIYSKEVLTLWESVGRSWYLLP